MVMLATSLGEDESDNESMSCRNLLRFVSVVIRNCCIKPMKTGVNLSMRNKEEAVDAVDDECNDDDGITLFAHPTPISDCKLYNNNNNNNNNKLKIQKKIQRNRLFLLLRLEEDIKDFKAFEEYSSTSFTHNSKVISAHYKEIGSTFYGKRITLTPKRGRGPRPNRSRSKRKEGGS